MLCRYPANLCVVKESDVVFKKFTNGCVRVVNRWLPDAFLFAIILTLIVFVAAMCATGMGPVEVIAKWGDAKGGFWNLLAFSMQMALVLVFGSAMASGTKARLAEKSSPRMVMPRTSPSVRISCAPWPLSAIMTSRPFW